MDGRGSSGRAEPSKPGSHANTTESGTTKPTTGGLSRTELAKARLEEKRQRLAQQRARMATGKAQATTGPPSVLLRSTSGASRAGSDVSSVTSPAAQAPGRGDGPTASLQPTRSNVSTMPRPASGALSEALRSPRSRSAAIDVPTSPARGLHTTRLAPEQQHHQEIPPQLPRPTVRTRPGAAVTPRTADATLGVPPAWTRPDRQDEGGRMQELASGGFTGAGRAEAPRPAALERAASQTSTPRRKVEYSPRGQLPAANSFAPRPAPAAEQLASAAASGRPAGAEKLRTAEPESVTASTSESLSARADAGLGGSGSRADSGQAGAGGSRPQADVVGFGSLTVALEPRAYPQQEQPLPQEPPKNSLQPPALRRAPHAPIPATAAPAGDAKEDKSSTQAASIPPALAAQLPEQQLLEPPSRATETVTAPPPNAVVAELQQPQPQPFPEIEPNADPQPAQRAFAALAAQQSAAPPWFGGEGGQEVGGVQALFPESAGEEEDSFWLEQGEPSQAAIVDVSQEHAAHSLAAQAAQLGRSPLADAPAPPPATEEHEPTAPTSAAEQSVQVQVEEPPSAPAVPVEAEQSTGQEGTLHGRNEPPAAAEPLSMGIPFAGGGASEDLFSGGGDLFGGAVGEEASFFEELDSAAGDASGAFANGTTATFEEPMPAPFASTSEQSHFTQPSVADDFQWQEQSQAGPSFGQGALHEAGTSGQEAAGWYDQGTASDLHGGQEPPPTDHWAESASQQPQAQQAWDSTWQAPQESHSQLPSFGQPSAAADAYANGGQNYFTAGWQAVQPKRPQTAAPKLAVPELRGPSSAAQTQPAFVNNQAGPPPPSFGQQQPSSAHTYFAQPPRAGAASFLPAAPPAFGRQQPAPAPLASSQWPVYNQQQQQFPPQPPSFPPSHAPEAVASAQQWQAPQALQWGQGTQEAAQYYPEASASQWPQSSSAGYAAWGEAASQEAGSYYPDPAEPLDATGTEQQAFNGAAEQAAQPQQGWQADPLQTAGPGWGDQSSAAGGPVEAVASAGASGYGAPPPTGPAPGLEVSDTDFWDMQDSGDSTQKPPALAETGGTQSVGPVEQTEQPQGTTDPSEPAPVSSGPQQGIDETEAAEVAAEKALPESAADESRPPLETQQQQPSWGGSEGVGDPAQVSAREQIFPAAHTDHGVSDAGEWPGPNHEQQPVELGSYQQADWNATQWRQQQAHAPAYGQPQPSFQPQWHQQLQASGAGYSQPHDPSYEYYSQQQPHHDVVHESAGPAVPGVTNRVSNIPFTPSPRTPSFHQPPAAVWGSQIRHQSAADSGLVPGTAAEGTRVAHGRPPCAVIAWGFGGRCAVMRPRMQGSVFSAGPVSLDMRWQPGQLHPMRVATLTADLAQLQPQAQWTQAGVKDDSQELLEQFPGPLTPSLPRDKVLAFIAGQAARGDEADRASVTAAMWHVLRLLAVNGGSLRSQTKGGKTKDQLTPEAQLAKVLVPEAGSTAAGVGWGNGVPSTRSPLPGGNVDPAAAASMQALLMSGQKAEALKVAVEGQLWGPALLLARTCGDRAFSDTATAMAAAVAAPGMPLYCAFHMLAGRPDAVLPAPGAAIAPAGPAGQAGGKSGPPSGSFGLKALLAGAPPKQQEAAPVEEEAGPSAAEVAMLTEWRENLAILAANMATPADEALIARLGDRLWQHKGQEDAAQLCYLVAGLMPQPYDPAARLCLLGADHRAAPRSLASIPALQRTEVLEWAKLPGAAQPGALTLPMLPYKVVYAARLAEAGLIAPAVHYVGLVQAALASFGAKVPPGLLVCRAMVAELEERLRTHASMFNLSVKHSQSSSFISGLGRFLDRGINKLISGGEVPPSGPPSTGSEVDPFGLRRRNDSGSPQHRRSGSAHAHTSSDSFTGAHGQPHTGITPSPAAHAAARSSSPGPQPPQPSGSAFANAGPPDLAAAAAERRGAPGNAPSSALSSTSSLRSMLGNLGGLLGAAAPASSKEARLGEENKFFYDKERGMWREQGAEIPAAAAPLPPPPAIRRAPDSAPSAGSAPPTGPSGSGPQPASRRTGAGARYVNTMNTSRPSTASHASLPPLVPTPAAKAAKPSFFVPTAARDSAAAQAPSFQQPVSSEFAADGPSPARIEAQQQQSPDSRLEYSNPPPTANSDYQGNTEMAGNGGGWPGGSKQGMGGRVGSFSQYLSPPVSNGTSQGPPSPPQPATASRLAPPALQPASAGSAANGGSQLGDMGRFVYSQSTETGQVAGGDYYTSYSAVLGGEATQQPGVDYQAMHGVSGWGTAQAQGQMDWGGQQHEAPGQNAGGWPGAAQMAPAPDDMTELEL